MSTVAVIALIICGALLIGFTIYMIVAAIIARNAAKTFECINKSFNKQFNNVNDYLDTYESED
jgi:hypothetical protein